MSPHVPAKARYFAWTASRRPWSSSRWSSKTLCNSRSNGGSSVAGVWSWNVRIEAFGFAGPPGFRMGDGLPELRIEPGLGLSSQYTHSISMT